MRTYRIVPVKLSDDYYERCNPDDPQAVWSVYSCDDENHPWWKWVADTPSQEMARALTDALKREGSERKIPPA